LSHGLSCAERKKQAHESENRDRVFHLFAPVEIELEISPLGVLRPRDWEKLFGETRKSSTFSPQDQTLSKQKQVNITLSWDV
jgi:hypothetical protein